MPKDRKGVKGCNVLERVFSFIEKEENKKKQQEFLNYRKEKIKDTKEQ